MRYFKLRLRQPLLPKRKLSSTASPARGLASRLPPRAKYFAAVRHLDHFARRPSDAEKISQVRTEPFGMGKKPMRFAIFDDVVKVIVTMADG